MDAKTFLQELSEYYERTKNDKVLSKIGFLLQRVDPKDYARILEDVIYNVPPSRVVGVAEVGEAMKRLEIYARPLTDRAVANFQVTCDCCGFSYHWAQSLTPEMRTNGMHDFCPRCHFPYYETITLDMYKMRKRAAMFEPTYEKIKDRYYQAWRSGQGGPQAGKSTEELRRVASELAEQKGVI